MHFFLNRLQANWKAGVTVGLISFPLSIALAIASGAGPIAGIITGFWAPLIAAFLGGSNYNIVGVAGALSTILFVYATGTSPALLPFLAIFAGFILLVMWAFRLEQYLRYIPTSVVYGFATGVAVLIASNQLFDALGLSELERKSHFFDNLLILIAHFDEVELPAVILFACSLAFLLLWKRYIKGFPGVIPMTIIGILIGFLSFKVDAFNMGLARLADRFPELSPTLWLMPDLAAFREVLASQALLFAFVQTGIIIAVIAALETLITARIGDKLTETRSSARKELFGLSFANIGSGFFGGLPATGVFIRTGANIKAGATHKTSQGVAALTCALLAFIFLPLFEHLPLVVMAAILFNTAIGLVELDKFAFFWRNERTSFIVGLSVAAVTVIHDASFGVMLGIVLALLVFINRVSRRTFEVTFNEEHRIVQVSTGRFHIPDRPVDTVIYSIAGFLSYLDSPQHLDQLKQLASTSSVRTVIIRLRNLFFTDTDGVETLSEAVLELERAGKQVLISSADPIVLRELQKNSVFARLSEHGAVYPHTQDALKKIGFTDEELLASLEDRRRLTTAAAIA